MNRSTLASLPCLALTLAGCSLAERTVMGGFLAFHQMEEHQLTMSDGYEATYFVHSYGDPAAPETLMFYVQGSGSETAQLSCRFLLDGLPGNVRVYALEKRYISGWSTGKGDPPRAHIEHHRPSTWLVDQREFVAHVLSRAETAGKNVVVLGASAGAITAAGLAQTIPQIAHLAMLGEGGMKEMDSFRLWGQRHDVDFDGLYRFVRDDPSTSKVISGHSHRWWLEMLEADPMESLATLEIPIFAAMGEKDESVPRETLTFLVDEFTRLGKDNLSTKVYVGCDHALDECHGNPDRAAFARDLMAWVRSEQL